MDSKTSVIFTIGYSTRTFDEFSQIIKNTLKVTPPYIVIDVRETNHISRNPAFRFPNYGIEYELSEMLWEEDFRYLHAPVLGNPMRKLSTFILSDTAKTFIHTLIRNKIIVSGKTILMCAEKDYRKCHRYKVAEYISWKFGWRVGNL